MTDYWIKLYIEILDDPKMGTLPDRLWRRTIELFLLAGRLNGNEKTGMLPDTVKLAWALRIPVDEMEDDLQQIARLTKIVERNGPGWIVRNFSKRQDAATATERWRAYRDRKRKDEYNSNDVQTNSLTETESDIDTESDTESDTDISALSDKFTSITGIIPGRNLKEWTSASQEMVRAGVTPDEIAIALKKMDTEGWQYSGLRSVVKTAMWVHSRRANNQPIFNPNGQEPRKSLTQAIDDAAAKILAREKEDTQNGNT